MNPKDQIPRPEESLDELVEDKMSSVDDFIRELEEKERDLHITADLQIEVEPTDSDPGTPGEPTVQDSGDGATMPSNGLPPARPRGSVEPAVKIRLYELEKEVESLHERLRDMRAERNEIQEKSDRRLKDFESFKYRMDRERRGAFIDQIANLAAAMLPVLDNLDRALASVDKSKVDATPGFGKFYDGIALVNQQVNEVLGEMGVEPIKTIGERFDPQLHEAVATEQREDVPNNSIAEEMLRGYRIGNRVIRHSMVKVSLGGLPDVRPQHESSDTAIELSTSDEPAANGSVEEPAATEPAESVEAPADKSSVSIDIPVEETSTDPAK